jgi:hypothetical protein
MGPRASTSTGPSRSTSTGAGRLRSVVENSYAGMSCSERRLSRASASAASNSATRSANCSGLTLCASTSRPSSRQTAWFFSSTTNRHGEFSTSPTTTTEMLHWVSAASWFSWSCSSGDGGADRKMISEPHSAASGCVIRASATEPTFRRWQACTCASVRRVTSPIASSRRTQ